MTQAVLRACWPVRRPHRTLEGAEGGATRGLTYIRPVCGTKRHSLRRGTFIAGAPGRHPRNIEAILSGGGCMQAIAVNGTLKATTSDRRAKSGRLWPAAGLPRISPKPALFTLWVLCLSLGLCAGAPSAALTGRVVDARTGEPVEQAYITGGQARARSDAQGQFMIPGSPQSVTARAWGYRSVHLGTAAGSQPALRIALEPFSPHALYLSAYGVGSRTLREAVLRLTDTAGINALVIDIKDDYGQIAYPSDVALAQAVGAQARPSLGDPRGLLSALHARGLYLIARIVVFKDDPLARAHPELAVKTAARGLFQDREQMAWTDPFQRAVWDYNIALGLEAARLGFDEVQFDYVRFPDAPGLVYAGPAMEADRVAAIRAFLDRAYRDLAATDAFVSADIFGYVCWNAGDTGIGQDLEALSGTVDYLSPMLYPSGFQFGIPGYRDPVAAPYEIVRLSLQSAQRRTGLSPRRFRPWLQLFRDYAFDHRVFGAAEVRAQVDAAEAFGSDGWMLWNPHNEYPADALPERTRAPRVMPGAAP